MMLPRVVSNGDRRSIQWHLGTLQYSPDVDGPWTDLPAASPFTLSPIGEKGFFRVKVCSFVEASDDRQE